MDLPQNSSIIKIPPVAIVGMASYFPEATTLNNFWSNVVNKRDSIIENDDFEGYWDKADYYDPNPRAEDKTYGYKAGFIPSIDFDPVEFKLPPKILESLSTAQIFGLYVAKKALEDAAIIDPRISSVDKNKVGVILGGGGNGNTCFALAARQQIPSIKKIFHNSGLPDVVADDIIERMKKLYLEWNEDSFPGFLGNVVCGRIASFFDLGGTSSMIDAACASSLAAIKTAVGELADGSCDAVLTGGVNIENSIFSFMCFSKTPALSQTNTSRPFDAESDGMMLGDGIGMLVLKRLDDAVRAQDKIYAVIKSISTSSDGRAKSIFAPRFEGQVKAIKRAYEKAGVCPTTIGLVEAHGTGTPSGDAVEFRSLKAVFEENTAKTNYIALGSVKSQIGHTRGAAGAASMIKVALALHHKVLPPTINIQKPNPSLGIEGSPFYLNTETRPWIQRVDKTSRRAAISSFGFGGTNYHAVLEEHTADHHDRYRLTDIPNILSFHDTTPDELAKQIHGVANALNSVNGDEIFNDVVESSRDKQIPTQSARVAMVVSSKVHAETLLKLASEEIIKQTESTWEHPKGIYYRKSADDLRGKVAALFPGQGSQYLNMAKNIANNYPEYRKVLASVDQVMSKKGQSEISNIVYPIPCFDEESNLGQQSLLTHTKYAQPAIGAVSLGYYHILKNMGFEPDFSAGHSYGEFTALHVAGVLDEDQFYELSVCRGLAMERPEENTDDRGGMLAVFAPSETIDALIEEHPSVSVANYNSKEQYVLGGPSETIRVIQERLVSDKVDCRLLPVAAAFHTSHVEHADGPLRKTLGETTFNMPSMPVFANATGNQYADSSDEIRETLSNQLLNAVKFKHMIENIYNQGGRCFVEIGPKGALSKLVANILEGKEHTIIAVNPSTSQEEELQFKKAIAKMLASGIHLNDIDRYHLPKPLPARNKSSLTVSMNGGFYLTKQNKQKRDEAYSENTEAFDSYIEGIVKSKLQIENNGVRSMHENEMNESLTTSPAIGNRKSNGSGNKGADTEAMSTYRGGNGTTQRKNGNNGTSHGGNGIRQQVKPSADRELERDTGLFEKQICAQNLMSQVHQQFQDNQGSYVSFLSKFVDRQYALLEKYQGSEQLGEVVQSLGQSISLLDRNQHSYHDNHQHYFQNQLALMSAPAQRSTNESPYPSVVYDTPVTESLPTESERRIITKNKEPSNDPIVRESEVVTEATIPSAPTPSMRPIPPVEGKEIAVRPDDNPVTESPTAENAENSPIMTEKREELIKELEKITVEEVIQRAITVISEKTGYPPEMIDVDMDLEADLGIDSIKRIEIIGAMFEDLSEFDEFSPEDSEGYQDLETFDIEQFSSIRKIAEFLMQTTQEIIAYLKGEKKPETDSATNEAADDLLQDSISVLPVVDAEIPELSKGNETAVNNSAKPTETQVVQSTTPAGFIGFSTSTEDIKDTEETIQIQPSVALKDDLAESPVVDLEAPKLLVEAGDKPLAEIKRYSIQKRMLPKPDQRSLQLPQDHIWVVTEDGQKMTTTLIKELEGFNQKVVKLSLGVGAGDECKNEKDRSSYMLSDDSDETIKNCLEEIVRVEGNIGGFIHVNPEYTEHKEPLALFREDDYMLNKRVFFLAKNLKPSLNQAAKLGDAYFFVVTRMDGELGTSGKQTFSIPTSGYTGLTKTLNQEWLNVFCRTIDIDPKCSPKIASAMIIEELQDSQRALAEVGRNSKKARMTLALIENEGTADFVKHKPDKASVFLVSGGARGVTAECVTELAKTYQSKFILLGRTKIDEALPTWSKDAETESALRAKAIKFLQKNDEQPNPIKIEKMLKSVLNRREITQHLENIKAAGSTVEYVTGDITGTGMLKNQISDAVAKLGAITGVIHGAGNLADKKIEKKTDSDYESVFGTKVKGLESLLKLTDLDKLQFFVLFSSVSGFFGNSGQADYSMANEVLNKFAHVLKISTNKCNICAINWGPWDSGMVNDTLKKVYRERDIAIIPTDIGARFCLDEFSIDGKSRRQIIIGSDNLPLSKKMDFNRVVLHRNVNVTDNIFLKDHIIDSNKVLPATCAIGWMVKACEDVLPSFQFVNIEDFQVLKGVVFDADQGNNFNVEITLDDKTDSRTEKQLSIVITSNLGETQIPHYRARITMTNGNEKNPIPKYEPINLEHEGSTDEMIYRSKNKEGLLFHGSSFQGIQKILNCNNNYLTTLCRLPEVSDKKQGQFVVNGYNPFIGDVVLQNALLWLLLKTDKGGLPAAVGKVIHYRELAFDIDFYVTMNCVSNNKSSHVSNIYVHDEEGKLYTVYQHVETTVSNKLRKILNG